jgi:hypothetical protein
VVTVRVPEISEDKLMEDLTQCATKQGRYDWHIGQACGDQNDTVRAIMRLTEDWSFLEAAGFILPDAVVGPDSLREDKAVAAFTWDMCKHAVVNELLTMSFYMDRPPYMSLDRRPYEQHCNSFATFVPNIIVNVNLFFVEHDIIMCYIIEHRETKLTKH